MTLDDEDKIWREALSPLAETVPEPPGSMEHRLLAEFRKTNPRPRRWMWFGVSFGAAAAMAAVLVWAFLFQPVPAPKALAFKRPAVQPSNVEEKACCENSIKKAPVIRPARRPIRRIPKAAAPQPEVATFYALPFADQSAPSGSFSVLRVTVPRSAMSAVGFTVNPDRVFETVQADVMVGDDGFARAIRFVQ
jgi:hypothetical protein